MVSAVLVITVLPTACDLTVSDYARIDPQRQLKFPRDHYAHPDFRTEWWYFNGRLQGPSIEDHAFQLVFFVRRTEQDFYYGLYPVSWYSNPAHLAHFTLMNLRNGEIKQAEKRSRDYRQEGGTAGALESSLSVWNDDWSLQEQDGELILMAAVGDARLELALDKLKPHVTHGEAGYFIKSAEQKQPRGSYYISYPRLAGSGYLKQGEQVYQVTASAWLDHEFGSFHLGENQTGWTWFSLQLENDSELMLYMLKHKDGSFDPQSKGTWIDHNGNTVALGFDDIQISPLRNWHSEKTNTSYTLDWRLSIPSLQLELVTSALLDDSEFDSKNSTMVVYWEGAVQVDGTYQTRPVVGTGFMELTGNHLPLVFLAK